MSELNKTIETVLRDEENEETAEKISRIKRKNRNYFRLDVLLLFILILILLYEQVIYIVRVVADKIPFINLTAEAPDDEDTDEMVGTDDTVEITNVNLGLTITMKDKEVVVKTTDDLRKESKNSKKEIVCDEFVSDSGAIVTDNKKDNTYYDIEDSQKKVETTEYEWGTGTSVLNSSTISYDYDVKTKENTAFIFGNQGNVEWSGFDDDLVKDYMNNRKMIEENRDSIVISVNTKSIENSSTLINEIIKILPEIGNNKGKNHTEYIGLYEKDNRVYVATFDKDIDITDELINTTKRVLGVDDVVIGKKDGYKTIHLTSTATIKNIFDVE